MPNIVFAIPPFRGDIQKTPIWEESGKLIDLGWERIPYIKRVVECIEGIGKSLLAFGTEVALTTETLSFHVYAVYHDRTKDIS